MVRLEQVYGYSYSVSEVAGGDHSSPDSKHYDGLAFDVNFINGMHVNSGHPDVNGFTNLCYNMGARLAFLEGNTHIHVDWIANGGNVPPSCSGGGASSPTITSPKLTGTIFTLKVQTQAGFNYTLVYKHSFTDANWTDVQTLGGTGGTITLTDTGATGASRLYNVRVEQP